MRDEKEERKKQARSNKQTRQSNTAHMYMYVISLTSFLHPSLLPPLSYLLSPPVSPPLSRFSLPLSLPSLSPLSPPPSPLTPSLFPSYMTLSSFQSSFRLFRFHQNPSWESIQLASPRLGHYATIPSIHSHTYIHIHVLIQHCVTV